MANGGIEKKKIFKFVGLIFSIIVLIFLVRFLNLGSFLDPYQLRDSLEAYGYFAPVLFMIVYAVTTVLFFPGTPFTILGGVLFGTFFGTFYVVIGATIGASIAFILAKFFGRGFIKDLIDKKFEKMKKYEDGLEKNGLPIVLFLRIVPLFPFNGLNFALGLTKVKTRDYFFGTLFGIIPGSFALAYLGDSIIMLDIKNIILAVGLLVILSLIWPVYKYIKKKRSQSKK